MRIGLFSDIHSNLEALEVVLDYFQKERVTHYLCLGDIVGYGANPNECIKRIKELRPIVVAGNHDYGVLGKTPLEDFNPVAKDALIWTKEQLSPESKKFLDDLELVEVFKPFYLVHSTPSAPQTWEYIFTLKDADYEFGYLALDICLIGHSHLPFVIAKTGNETKFLPTTEISLSNSSRYLINLGSVGQPRDGNPKACVAVFDTKTNILKFARLDYDIESAKNKILKAGLPEYLAYRLQIGQ